LHYSRMMFDILPLADCTETNTNSCHHSDSIDFDCNSVIIPVIGIDMSFLAVIEMD